MTYMGACCAAEPRVWSAAAPSVVSLLDGLYSSVDKVRVVNGKETDIRHRLQGGSTLAGRLLGSAPGVGTRHERNLAILTNPMLTTLGGAPNLLAQASGSYRRTPFRGPRNLAPRPQ